MIVFASKPFRYNSIDYAYGWLDLTQALADVLIAAGLVSNSGATGPTGPTGPAGAAGATGAKGNKGDTGTLAVAFDTPPASATATGTTGTIVFGNDGYLYLCTATDTWVRVQLATWV
jgi:hypothetical protein